MSTNLMSKPVLVINASYEPLNICSTKRAMKLLIKDVAVTEQEHDIVVHGNWYLPSVIRLKHFRKVPLRIQEATRKNIFIRDRKTCQYCGHVFNENKLTLDHVHPKSRGGKSDWQNLVAACQPCNLKKADRTPVEANMPLLKIPRSMTVHTTRDIMRSAGAEDPKWRQYLYYDSNHHADLVAID